MLKTKDVLFLLGFVSGVSLSLFIFNNVFAIESGPIFSPQTSTQSKYCSNGTCSTGPQVIINKTGSVLTHKYNMISLMLSETCQRMNEHNISGCPHISELIVFDTSNQAISGKFIQNGSDYTRTSPQIKNHYLWYGTNRTNEIICLDCEVDAKMSQTTQQVIIEPHDFVWTDKFNTLHDGSRIFVQFHGRYMQGCDTATIPYDFQLLTDTIYYMRMNCDSKYTTFNATQTYELPSTPFNYDNPFSTLHQDSYLKDITGHKSFGGNHTGGGLGPSNCITNKCDYHDPYHKVGY